MGVYMCMCAHNLLDSAQKLEDGHDVGCVCVCMYICYGFVAKWAICFCTNNDKTHSFPWSTLTSSHSPYSKIRGLLCMKHKSLDVCVCHSIQIDLVLQLSH